MWHNTSVGLSSIWPLKCFYQVNFGAYWLGQFTLTFIVFSHRENLNDGDNCFTVNMSNNKEQVCNSFAANIELMWRLLTLT